MVSSDWLSERILFGLLIISGYFLVVIASLAVPVFVAVYAPAALPAAENASATAKDALLVVGPLLGVIVQAIWKTDRTEKANAETISGLVSAVQTAQSQPAAGVVL